MIRLHLNENPFVLDSPLRAVAERSLGLDLYPDRAYADGYAALARWLDVDASTLVLGNGSSDILRMLYIDRVGRGKRLFVPWPSYIYYRELDAQRAAEYVPLRNDTVDLDAIAAASSGHRAVIIICNPNNPTGSLLPRSAIAAFLSQLAPETTVIVDEAYIDFAPDPAGTTALPLIDRFPDLVVIRTFSKLFGLAGLRLGYAVTHPAGAEHLRSNMPTWHVNQVAASVLTVLPDHEGYFAAVRTRIIAERVRFAAELARTGFRVSPSAANFLYVRHPDAAALAARAADHGVLVRTGMELGADIDALRITVGLPEQNDLLLSVLSRSDAVRC